MHDSSRDLLLVNTHRSERLKNAIGQERQKSRKMENMMTLLDKEMKRTDDLLHQMIPQSTVDSLRKGDQSASICKAYEEVSILFSSIVDFEEIANNSKPMEIVSLLNTIFSIYDKLIEKHTVHKVETVSDSYMLVGGVPIPCSSHAVSIANMALDMMNSIYGEFEEECEQRVRIRIGIHCGPIVAGVVGVRLPRYCLFGDTVNTASRMQSNSEPMRIHISEDFKIKLKSKQYKFQPRSIKIKGKGQMNTYYLEDNMDSYTHSQHCQGKDASLSDQMEDGSVRKLEPKAADDDSTTLKVNVEQEASNFSVISVCSRVTIGHVPIADSRSDVFEDEEGRKISSELSSISIVTNDKCRVPFSATCELL